MITRQGFKAAALLRHARKSWESLVLLHGIVRCRWSTSLTMCYAPGVKRAVIRLPSEIVDRLDRLAEELTASVPGKKFSRASVVRVLLARGFGAVAADREQLNGDLEGEPVKRGRKARSPLAGC